MTSPSKTRIPFVAQFAPKNAVPRESANPRKVVLISFGRTPIKLVLLQGANSQIALVEKGRQNITQPVRRRELLRDHQRRFVPTVRNMEPRESRCGSDNFKGIGECFSRK